MMRDSTTTRTALVVAALAWLAMAHGAAAQAENGPPAIRVTYRSAGVPTAPGDAAWKEAPETRLTLTPQIIIPPNGGGSVPAVSVRGLHDGEWLALRLEWADASADREVGVDTFRDAAAVGFPIADADPPPSPFMGDAEHPVGIWQWTADLEATALGRGGFAERYPHTEGVWYFPQDASVKREVQAWRGTDPVVEFVATGFGTLTRLPGTGVRATSEHTGKRWAVVLTRRLATGDPKEASFLPGERTAIIVAIWNGAMGEVNGRKSVTLAWTPLVLDATVSADARR